MSAWAEIAQSVERSATGWTVRGSDPARTRFSGPKQTDPEAHPFSCRMGNGSLFRGAKRLRCGADHLYLLLSPR